MNITCHSFFNLDHQKKCYSIHSNEYLTAEVAENIRAEIINCQTNDFPIIYLDATKVQEVDLSGINEVIHSHYTLQHNSKKLIFVYAKNSSVEKWVQSTGLDKFIDTAIIL